MSSVLIAVLAAAVVAVAVVALRRRRTDGVDSFRRQIDALSSESRRHTVDQVRDAARRRERAAEHDAADGGPTDGHGASDPGDGPDEGGVRGS